MRLFVLLLALLPAWPVAAGPTIANGAVVLRALDKVTARVSVIEGRVGEEMVFGSLAIRPRACFTAPPTEAPESAAFLEIRETDGSDPAQDLFSGWMFASSPGLSALEHPVYDVWMLGCSAPMDPEAEPSATQSPNG
jgi:hypothetical protein